MKNDIRHPELDSGSNIPKLRFPELVNSGEWEEKFVEDFFDVGSSKRVLQEEWINQGVPFYRTRELVSLSKNEPFGSEIFISEELFLELSKKYGIPSAGDFLISGVGTLGICYQVQNNDKFYFKDGNVIWFKLVKKLNSNYFKYCFQSDYIQNQIFAQSSASTVGTYTIQNAKKTKFWYPPTFQEQQKIADCLSSVDSLILAQSQKVELLKEHKKGLMQQLFPQDGEEEPKLRFPEFKNATKWEEKTLGDVGKVSMCKRIMKDETTETGEIPFYKIGTFGKKADAYIDKELYEDYRKKYSFPKKGDILISASGTIGRLVVYDGLPAYFQDSNIVWIANNEELVKNSFLLFFYDTVKWTTSDTTIARLYNDNLRSVQILIPSIKEQQKIADCLSSVDEQITSQTQKLQTLKEHKKALMQQLFPSKEVQQ